MCTKPPPLPKDSHVPAGLAHYKAALSLLQQGTPCGGVGENSRCLLSDLGGGIMQKEKQLGHIVQDSVHNKPYELSIEKLD